MSALSYIPSCYVTGRRTPPLTLFLLFFNLQMQSLAQQRKNLLAGMGVEDESSDSDSSSSEDSDSEASGSESEETLSGDMGESEPTRANEAADGQAVMEGADQEDALATEMVIDSHLDGPARAVQEEHAEKVHADGGDSTYLVATHNMDANEEEMDISSPRRVTRGGLELLCSTPCAELPYFASPELSLSPATPAHLASPGLPLSPSPPPHFATLRLPHSPSKLSPVGPSSPPHARLAAQAIGDHGSTTILPQHSAIDSTSDAPLHSYLDADTYEQAHGSPPRGASAFSRFHMSDRPPGRHLPYAPTSSSGPSGDAHVFKTPLPVVRARDHAHPPSSDRPQLRPRMCVSILTLHATLSLLRLHVFIKSDLY